ncbi:MAG TPA: threonylcarbamoyl-AMP synthase [Candidatus Aminicenantes bacterium]|nr:threonylcarbamoyl-AMP synthase [Candidatus Aminicenantes bacterium]
MTPPPPLHQNRVWPLSRLNSSNWRRRLQRLLEGGGLVVYPTDTLYGMGGDFRNLDLHRRIGCIKARAHKSYSVAVWDMHALTELSSALPSWLGRNAGRVFPGPYTMILPANPGLNRNLLHGADTIGLRIPAHPFPRKALAEIRIPLISTSVNRSGSPPLSDPAEILGQFPEIDLLIDAGRLPPSRGSSILDLTVSPPRILRRGEGLELLRDLGIT